MLGKVFVDPGDEVPLDRASLSGPPPGTTERLLEYCDEWARDVGWQLAFDAAEADAVVIGPDVTPPAHQEVVRVERAQGIDGFRWGIRHLGFTRRWPFETVPYGLIDDQLMDGRRPRRDPRRGVVILVHGGFWMEAWRRDLMDGLAVDLAERGWESWNVEYGRVGGTGGWPRSVDDVVAAIDAVSETAAADSVILIGHSAGAQLALLAAGRRPELVEQVVSLAGLCDLEAALQQRLGGGAVERFLDGAPPAAASPVEQMQPAVPVVLAHCAGDTVVPVHQSRRYAEVAAGAGVGVDLLELDQGNHMSLIEPESAWRSVVPLLGQRPDGARGGG